MSQHAIWALLTESNLGVNALKRMQFHHTAQGLNLDLRGAPQTVSRATVPVVISSGLGRIAASGYECKCTLSAAAQAASAALY